MTTNGSHDAMHALFVQRADRWMVAPKARQRSRSIRKSSVPSMPTNGSDGRKARFLAARVERKIAKNGDLQNELSRSAIQRKIYPAQSIPRFDTEPKWAVPTTTAPVVGC
jgi:hypothetical protein